MSERKTIPGLRAELCPVCNELFSCTAVGDKHRVGDYYDHRDTKRPYQPRRCLSADEMRVKGLVQNAKGVWHGAGSAQWSSRRENLTRLQAESVRLDAPEPERLADSGFVGLA